MKTISLRSLVASLILCSCCISGIVAQDAPKPLPPGMKGSNVDDPRAKLSPGMYDAGESAMGIKHVGLVKKPDAFQLGTDNTATIPNLVFAGVVC